MKAVFLSVLLLFSSFICSAHDGVMKNASHGATQSVPHKQSSLWPYLAYYSARVCCAGAEALCAVVAGRRAARNEWLRDYAFNNVLANERVTNPRFSLTGNIPDLDTKVEAELVAMKIRSERESFDEDGNVVPTQGVWAVRPTAPLILSCAACYAVNTSLTAVKSSVLSAQQGGEPRTKRSLWWIGMGMQALGSVVRLCGNVLWYQFGKKGGVGHLCAALVCTMAGCAAQECGDCLYGGQR